MPAIFSLTGILQIFCLYHAYKHKRAYYWYLVILFLPVAGSLIYLAINFGTPDNIEKVSEKIRQTANPNYQVDALLREAKYADTLTNRIKLADAYAARQEYLQAITIYQSCLEGYNADDESTIEKLLVAYYFVEDYPQCVHWGDRLRGSPTFHKSESIIPYAWALYHTGDLDKAQSVFESFDVRFSHYTHRLELAKYYQETSRRPEAESLLQEIVEEITHMDHRERRMKREVLSEAKSLLKRL